MSEWMLYTLIDAYEPRQRSSELITEYRLGYRDGFIAGIQALEASWFMGKERACQSAFDFWQRDLNCWLREKQEAFILPPDASVRCIYCGRPAQQKDHIFPRSRGGPDADWNFAPACANCNNSKSDRTPQEWQENEQ